MSWPSKCTFRHFFLMHRMLRKPWQRRRNLSAKQSEIELWCEHFSCHMFLLQGLHMIVQETSLKSWDYFLACWANQMHDEPNRVCAVSRVKYLSQARPKLFSHTQRATGHRVLSGGLVTSGILPLPPWLTGNGASGALLWQSEAVGCWMYASKQHQKQQ